MVERIVSAGARVLEDSGYRDASTNRIAREAGISPGSLYQYYPDKDAIVSEIILRLIDDFASAITPALRAAATEQPPDAIRLILGAVLDALQQQTALLRALADRVPAIEQQEALRPVRGRLADLAFHSLASRRDALRHADLERTTWMIVELTQHLLVRYVLDAPPIGREDFLSDTSRIVLDLAYRADLWTGL
ncbi:MAG: TetR/AcrR family transcriptional regulator [Solirubrobacteraceae bacterium]|jgi:AcrR family transcriptional regulator